MAQLPSGAAEFLQYLRLMLGRLDVELSKWSLINQVAARSGVPRVYIFVAGALLAFAFLFLGLGASFLTTLVAVAYPTYASLRAIESPGKADDTQWCAALLRLPTHRRWLT
jgi:receptor expression-enhancing protein 5/6